MVNHAGGTEIARYDLSEDASTETAMVFGELYRKRRRVEVPRRRPGVRLRLAGIAADFGVNV
ncbi:TerD family protein [Streptomyces stelliscabiei]